MIVCLFLIIAKKSRNYNLSIRYLKLLYPIKITFIFARFELSSFTIREFFSNLSIQFKLLTFLI